MNNSHLADALARIQNAIARKAERVSIPKNKLITNCAKCLQDKGVLGKLLEEAGYFQTYAIIYEQDGSSRFSKFRMLSKPSVRRYVGVKELAQLSKRCPQNQYIVSTNQNCMYANTAVSNNVGGELLFACMPY